MGKAGEGDKFRSEQAGLGNPGDGGWRGELQRPSGFGCGAHSRVDAAAGVGTWGPRARVGTKPADETGPLPALQEQPSGERRLWACDYMMAPAAFAAPGGI